MKKTIVAALLTTMVAASCISGCAGAQKAPEAAEETTQEAAPEEAAPEEAAPEEAAPEEAAPEEAAAEEAAPAEAVTEEAAAAEAYPAFHYTGEDIYGEAIAQYILSEFRPGYPEADISLPVSIVVGKDEADPQDIKVWGDFWVYNYNLRGTTLMNKSGGSYPGVMHLKTVDGGFEVTGAEIVEDGESYQESLEKIFPTQEMRDALHASYEQRPQAEAEAARMYADSTGIDIKATCDYGWDPVPVREGEEIDVTYPELGGDWSAEDGTLMSVEMPEDGNVYRMEIKAGEDVWTVYGQYEASTAALYYWDCWKSAAGAEEDMVNEEGCITVNEDGTLTWKTAAGDTVFTR